jgi:hypothetical protein
MSSDPAVRALRHPPANFSQLKIPKTLQPAREWFRVHQSGLAARHFSLNTHHRFSHRDCPCSFLYLGVDVGTCLFERFGDEAYDRQRLLAKSLWDACCLSAIRLPEMQVCDLTRSRTLSALMVDLTALTNEKLAIPQEWGLAIQRHPGEFEGIKFKSRFNNRPCLALFQRGQVEKRMTETLLGALSEQDAALDWLDDHRVSLY